MFEVVVFVDMGGMLEYWIGLKIDFVFFKKVLWEYKIDIDLYEFVKVIILIYLNCLLCRLDKFVIKWCLLCSFIKY